MLGIYWIVVYTLQIGFCLILVTARKEETKVSTLVAYRVDGGRVKLIMVLRIGCPVDLGAWSRVEVCGCELVAGRLGCRMGVFYLHDPNMSWNGR